MLVNTSWAAAMVSMMWRWLAWLDFSASWMDQQAALVHGPAHGPEGWCACGCAATPWAASGRRTSDARFALAKSVSKGTTTVQSQAPSIDTYTYMQTFRARTDFYVLGIPIQVLTRMALGAIMALRRTVPGKAEYCRKLLNIVLQLRARSASSGSLT